MGLLSRNLSIRSRLLLMVILVSSIASAVLISIGYINGKEAIEKGIFNQLTGIRAAKQYQIESYFKQMSGIVEVLGTNETVAEAMIEFKNSFSSLNDNNLDVDCSRQLSLHYEKFVDKLSNNLEITPNLDLYYPNTSEACYLQFEYIIDNPNPLGEKHLMSNARDGSDYSKIHQRFHEYLTNVILQFGFYDIFLIDLERGDIVYSAYKETDFATNLYTGPYRESNLALLARQLRTNSDIRKPRIIDFESYRPSYGAPAAFIGIPIIKNAQTVGALVLQLPVDEIDNIMTGSRNWEADGLGKSGETYLVGEDFLMRSISRFYLEDTVGFQKTLTDIGVQESKVDLMYSLGTTIAQQRVKTEGVDAALNGKTETKTINDYRGIPVLSSFSKLKIEGLNWVILSEIDLAEAEQPVEDFKKKVFIALCIIILLLTFFAMYLAGQFVKPIEQLTEGVNRLQAGDYSSRIDLDSKDEFGTLANSFNSMIADIEKQHELIEKQAAESERLLLNFIPESVARKLQKGEKDIAEKYTNTSLIVVDVVGFSKLSSNRSPLDSIHLLNELVDAFDACAEKHGVEKIKTIGDTYFAVCGMFNTRLDHAQRVLAFAREMRRLIGQININFGLKLTLHFGLHSGDILAGVIGHDKFNYDLFGETVNDVFDLKEHGIDNTILVSDDFYKKVKDLFSFKKSEVNDMRFEVWEFEEEA